MMSWENLIDTLLNVIVFVFIGVLIWLYFKKESTGGGATGPASPSAAEESD